MTGQA